MEFKFYDNKFEWNGNFGKIKSLLESVLLDLGHREGAHGSGLSIYNHTCLDNLEDLHWSLVYKALFVKPTAPTSMHFAIDDLGYANSSSLAFHDPSSKYEAIYSHLNPKSNMDWTNIENLIERKTNKWDDSILLKWKPAKDIPKNHILIIGQMPEDEVNNGFGFKGHFERLEMIVNRLKGHPIIVKLHPRFKPKGRVKDTIDKWIQDDIDVRTGYNSIHDFLPYTRVAIVDNSTSGIECLMHEVPVISYGWPEYHWVTQKLQSLTQLKELVDDISWHKKDSARKFIYWYIHDYLCSDYESTKKRLHELIES